VVTAGTVDWPLVDLLEHAEHLAEPDPALRAELLSRRAIELYWEEPADAWRRSGEALEVAEGSGDDHAVGVALHARQFTLRGPDGLAERIAIGRRLVQLGARLGDLDLAFEGHTWLAADVLRAGDMAGFLAELDALEQVAQRSREPLHRWYAMVYRAELAAIRGRLEEARPLTEEAAALGARLEVAVSEGYRVAQLAVLARDTGTLAEIEPDVRQAIERLPYFPTLKATLALVLAEGGHAAAARVEIHQLSPGRFAAIPPDSLWTTSVALLGEAAAIAGSPHLAVLAELLEPHSGEFLVHGIPACWGAADRVRGVLAAAAGRWPDADIALAAALAAHEALGAPGWVARTKLDQARLAAMDGRPAAAVAAAREASAEAAALGLHGIALAADRLLSEAVDPSVRLSRREREVLTLLATGAANKEIAASLVVSVHTVERHLANIYTKIGARSRSEATAFAVRHGLA
jgi:DNA-binding CsgD family transcriptional regulator